jgi:glycerophosphoryl diester phosphodiesterase
LNGNRISAFGHGGMGVQFKFPINSYESVEPCLRIGAKGTEMDIQMTNDSILVAYHNENLNESTPCSGTINDLLWSQIWSCHYASPFSSTIKLRSVSEILSDIPYRNNYTFTFDCKSYNHSSNQTAFRHQYANAIINLIDAYALSTDKIYIESQDTAFLRILQTKNNSLKLFIYPGSFEQGLAIAQEMNLFGITISTNNITKEQVRIAHDKGIWITLFNTKTKDENLNAILKSPDVIQSDEIIYLLKVFGEYKD